MNWGGGAADRLGKRCEQTSGKGGLAADLWKKKSTWLQSSKRARRPYSKREKMETSDESEDDLEGGRKDPQAAPGEGEKGLIPAFVCRSRRAGVIITRSRDGEGHERIQQHSQKGARPRRRKKKWGGGGGGGGSSGEVGYVGSLRKLAAAPPNAPLKKKRGIIDFCTNSGGGRGTGYLVQRIRERGNRASVRPKKGKKNGCRWPPARRTVRGRKERKRLRGETASSSRGKIESVAAKGKKNSMLWLSCTFGS